MCIRDSLYTAVTRARKCVTVVGNEETFAEMIRNEKQQKRYSALDERIREPVSYTHLILGRIHNYEQFLETYRSAREAGFDNINIDLMLSLIHILYMREYSRFWMRKQRSVSTLKTVRQ